MEVILLERVEKLGNVGDLVKVKNGYARNFLIPRNKCLRATNENKAFFETQRAHIEKENETKRKDAAKVASKIEDKFYVLIRSAGEDGRLYGSVAARDIAEIITETGVEINRTQVSLDKSIKYLGVYPVRVAAHAEVIVTVRVNVARSETEAKEAEKEFLNPTVKKDAQNEEVKADSSEEKTGADVAANDAEGKVDAVAEDAADKQAS